MYNNPKRTISIDSMAIVRIGKLYGYSSFWKNY